MACGLTAIDLIFQFLVELIPKLKIIPESLTVQEGDAAEFICNVKSPRHADIVWSRRDDKSFSKRAIINGSVLRFVSLQKRDAGVYLCTANNGIALRTAQSLLVVKSK